MQILKTKRKLKKREGRSRRGEGSVFLRGTTYWYKIPNPSGEKPLSGSCGTDDYDQAIAIKNRYLVAAHDRKRKPAGVATVNEILDDYELYVEKHRPKSFGSIRTAIKHLRKVVGNKVADNLTTNDVNEFRRQREEDAHCKFSTVNRELGYLRAALVRETKSTPPRVTVIPFMAKPSEKNCIREGFIDRDGYKKILGELPDSLKAIFVCSFHTGARLGELKQVTWKQVDLRKGIIELRASITKTSEGRWLPIWGDMGEYLKRQKAIRDEKFPSCEWVFFWMDKHSPKARPGNRLRDFRSSWSDACERAGHAGLLFHDLRRSAIKFADQEAGISSDLVRLMSGHKTASIYSRYNIRGEREVVKIGRTLDAFVGKKESGTQATN